MTTLRACTTSCKPGLLEDLLNITSRYSFLLMEHSYIATKHPTAGCSFGLSTICTLDYATQNLSSSQAASFLVPLNPARSTPICFHRFIISLLYNTKGLEYSTHLHLRTYRDPFPSLWLHQLIVLVQLRCLALLGTVANKGAKYIAELLGGVEMGTHITTQ
jgi:hypothetical protein